MEKVRYLHQKVGLVGMKILELSYESFMKSSLMPELLRPLYLIHEDSNDHFVVATLIF